MNNHDGLLRKYFLQAKEQPSLLSSDEARSILLQSGKAQERGTKGPGARGVIVTLAIGAAVMVAFLSLPRSGDSNDRHPGTFAEAGNAASVVEPDGRDFAGMGEPRTESTQSSTGAHPKSRLATATGTAPISSASASAGSMHSADGSIVEPNRLTEPGLSNSSFTASFIDSKVAPHSSLSHGDAAVNADDPTESPEATSVNEGIAVQGRPALGYTIARTELAPLPEIHMTPGSVEITRLASLNTPFYDDYNPMVTADGRTLYFISNREHGLGGHDFWVARKKSREDVHFSEPQNLGSGINTSRDEGSASISADGQTMYFTGCHRPDGLGECDIYEARLQEEGWMEVRNLREINTRYWEAQPTVSADGRALYFISNRPGVFGGHKDADIYVSHKLADGTWSKPENLGRTINTPEREDSPFIAPGGDALYFSSAGHKGMGGLDFFVTHKGPDGAWEKPENLGTSFNTPNDERFITLPAAEDVIYFASSDGKGGLDLYMARRSASSASIVVNGSVIEEATGRNLSTRLLFVDGESGEVLAGTRTSDDTEEFSLVIGEGSMDREIHVYGLTDSLGEFRARISLPSTDSYREYRCDFILDSHGSESGTVSNEWSPELHVTAGSSPDQLTVEAPVEESGELAILDAWGHRLIQKHVRSGSSERIDMSTAPDGLYLIRLGRNVAVIPIDRSKSPGRQ